MREHPARVSGSAAAVSGATADLRLADPAGAALPVARCGSGCASTVPALRRVARGTRSPGRSPTRCAPTAGTRRPVRSQPAVPARRRRRWCWCRCRHGFDDAAGNGGRRGDGALIERLNASRALLVAHRARRSAGDARFDRHLTTEQRHVDAAWQLISRPSTTCSPDRDSPDSCPAERGRIEPPPLTMLTAQPPADTAARGVGAAGAREQRRRGGRAGSRRRPAHRRRAGRRDRPLLPASAAMPASATTAPAPPSRTARAGVLDADTTLADSVLLTGDEIVVGPGGNGAGEPAAGAGDGGGRAGRGRRHVDGAASRALRRWLRPCSRPAAARSDRVAPSRRRRCVRRLDGVAQPPHRRAAAVHRVGTGTTAQPLGRTTITAPTAIGEHDDGTGCPRLMIRPFVRDPLPASAPASDDASLGHVEFHRTPYHRQRITPRRLDPLDSLEPTRATATADPRRARPGGCGLDVRLSGGNPRSCCWCWCRRW